jgi:hypothetical protein
MKRLIIREGIKEETIELLEIDIWKQIIAFEKDGHVFKLQSIPGGQFIFVNLSGATYFDERIYFSYTAAIRASWAIVYDIYVFDDFKSFLTWVINI